MHMIIKELEELWLVYFQFQLFHLPFFLILIQISHLLNVCIGMFCRTKIDFSVGGEFFSCTGQNVTVKGFTSLMPWLAVSEKSLPRLFKGEKIELSKVDLYEVFSDAMNF